MRNAALVRCLQIAKRLEGRRYVDSLDELALTFGVTTRTIRRDLEVLQETGWIQAAWKKAESPSLRGIA